MPALAAAMSSGLLILSDLIVTPAEAVLLVQALPAPGAALDHGVALGALGAVDAATIGRALVVATLALEATRAVQLAPVTRRRWLGLRRVREAAILGTAAAPTARWPAGSPESALLATLAAAPALAMSEAPVLPALVDAMLGRAVAPLASWTAARFAALADRGLLASGGRDEGGTGARWHAAPGTRDRALQAQVTAAALLDRCRTTRPLLAGLVQAGVATALERADRAVPVR